VARLIATSACAGLLPLTIGAITLTEVVLGPVTSIAPFRGKSVAVTAALAVEDLRFPAPGETISAGPARIIWAGQGRAFLCGVTPPMALAGVAALTDQTDAAAVVRLDGAGAEAVLARLVPVDLRARAFPEGGTARTMVGHMTASITRVGAQSFEVMVMRSMAQTLVHELSEAAIGVAAR
jgi:sarcosine oxidase gamma subunit